MPSETTNSRIEFWKSKLIDLSLRNKLLNYRAGKSSAVPVLDEVPRLVVDRLLSEDGSFRFLPRPEGEAPPRGGAAFERVADDALESSHKDDLLQTPLTRKELDRALYNLFLKSRTSFEEQGVVTLFLAVGMLRWYEEPGKEDSHLAPILLIPATLSRAGAGRPFTLSAANVEPEVNPSLLRKLKVDFGLEPQLPDLHDGFDPDAVFEAFRRRLPDPRWQVLSDIHLGLFSFSKYLMYRDLEDQAEVLLSNPLVGTLAGEEKARIAEPEIPDPSTLDGLHAPEDVYQIMDADSSQWTAIELVRRGGNLVLQGPPGTGKSQTIANLVAEILAAGKTVLFVSEKMAALEVVKRRLDQAGLGDYVLELHSRHAAKRDVVRELKRCLERDRAGPAPSTSDLDRVPAIREKLDAYVRALHDPFGEGGLSPFEAHGVLARLTATPDVLFDLESPEAIGEEEVRRRARLLNDLAGAREAVEPILENPWRFAKATAVSRTAAVQIKGDLGALEDLAGEFRRLTEMKAASLGLEDPPDLEAAGRHADLLAHLERSPRPEPGWVTDPHWAGATSEGKAIAEKGLEYAAKREDLSKHYLETLYDLALDDLASRRERHGTGFFRFFRISWWRDRKLVRAARRPGGGRALKDEIEDLKTAVRVRDLGDGLDALDRRGKETFGRFWKGRETDWEEIAALGEWVVKARRLCPMSPPPQEVADAAKEPRHLDGSASELRGSLGRVKRKLAEVAAALEADEMPQGVGEIGDWAAEALARFEAIVDWAAYRRALLAAGEAGLSRFLEAAEAAGIGHAVLADCHEKAFHTMFLDRAAGERPALRDFDRRKHEEVIERFQELDRKQFVHAVARIRAKLDAELPSSRSFSPKSDVGLLLREAAKKRRHMPIRKLLDAAGAAVRRLKPCFMMSPNSIAQYLPPSSDSFDLIVFDEASQICPEDAIGAIARGRQIAVVGDSKQLPPTSFFSYDPDLEEEEVEDPPPDMESILDLCSTSGLPSLRLRWHYRSRDESLIAFSNYHFYDGDLYTFPNPGDRPGLGVSLHHVRDGVYDRGRTRANRREAEEVSKAIARQAAAQPELTIGCVTFSEAQQRAVLEALDELRRNDPGLDAYWDSHPDEPPFVKNLENVQGDERDVMFFSVGYGRDAEGKLTMNFGPLNGDGGHRRLNVAITRAKRAVKVFSSILPEDIDPERARGAGARLLRDYLEYARRGVGAATAAAGTGGPAAELSPFEAALALSIVGAGFHVVPRVGASDYRLDFGVARREEPGRFLLGIQCDGAMYRDAATARDRDRTRPLVLDRLGWKLTRVWSTEWVRTPHRELERVSGLMAGGAEPPSSPPEPPPQKKPEAKEEPEPETPEPAETDLPGVETYRVTPKKLRRTTKKFSEDNPDIPRFVAAVVRYEGPIHEDLLARRIAETYDTRTTASVREATRLSADIGIREGHMVRRGQFLWPAGRTGCALRAPAKDDSPRDAEHVPPEEIADGIRTVLEVDLRLPREALLKAVGNLLGHRRPSDTTLFLVDEVLRGMIAGGRAGEDEAGLVSLPD